MSFTSIVKNEICTLDFGITQNIALLSGFFRGSFKFSLDKIELSSENAKVARKIYTLIKNTYGVDPSLEQKKFANFRSKKIYVITVSSHVKEILSDLSIIDDSSEYMNLPSEYIVSLEDDIRAYIVGSFLARGSINDPKTQYHLELSYDNKYEAVFTQRLLNMYELNSKIIVRDTKYMVYVKEAEKICDFLKIMGASSAVLYYENVRIHKEQKNNTNRLNNCEQANTEKTVEAAMNEVKQIEYIDSVLGLDMLDEKISITCKYRLKYPEASLSELSEIISLETGKSVSKSGLNHRFRKIKKIYETIKKDK